MATGCLVSPVSVIGSPSPRKIVATTRLVSETSRSASQVNSRSASLGVWTRQPSAMAVLVHHAQPRADAHPRCRAAADRRARCRRDLAADDRRRHRGHESRRLSPVQDQGADRHRAHRARTRPARGGAGGRRGARRPAQARGLLDRVIDVAVRDRRVVRTLQFDPVIVRLLAEHEPFQRFIERLYRVCSATPARTRGSRRPCCRARSRSASCIRWWPTSTTRPCVRPSCIARRFHPPVERLTNAMHIAMRYALTFGNFIVLGNLCPCDGSGTVLP